ncbi:MAG: CPBP family intramembrane glutamic endopeptidase [Pseudomonadota bacterium]
MTAFERYLDAGRSPTNERAGPEPALWTLVLGLLALISSIIVFSIIGMALGVALAEPVFGIATDTHDTLQGWMTLIEDHRILLFATLLGLASMIPITALLLWSLHDRSFGSLLGAGRGLHGRNLALGAAAAIVSSTLGMAVLHTTGIVSVTVQSLAQGWWIIAVLFACLIPLQATAEEVVFRGYFLQGLANRFRHISWSPLIWIGLPAILFTAAHLDPESEGGYWPLIAIGGFALFATALVVITGGLSAAIGYHVANNLMALLVFEPPFGIEGVGALKISVDAADLPWLMLVELLALIGLYFVLRPLLRREDEG